jgi:hypothetical protein
MVGFPQAEFEIVLFGIASWLTAFSLEFGRFLRFLDALGGRVIHASHAVIRRTTSGRSPSSFVLGSDISFADFVIGFVHDLTPHGDIVCISFT